MHLQKQPQFTGRKGPVLVVVADGVGLAPDSPANAVSLANTPNIDQLLKQPNSTRLHAHGTHVGLPTDQDMGNSEVGHNTLGSGRIFDQGAKLVANAFADGSLFNTPCWQKVIQQGNNGTVHFIGLLSDGNVHSNEAHLHQMLAACHAQQIKSVCVHCLLDGRDVAPRSAIDYIEKLQAQLDTINQDTTYHYRIASAGGRMAITMDRYEADWDMVERGFRTHIHADVGNFGRQVVDVVAEIQRQYSENETITDQELTPFVVVNNDKPVGKVCDGDAVVLFNFRGDRAIEICQTLEQEDFNHFDRGELPDIYFCGMLEYDGDLKVPQNYLVNPPVIREVMGEYLCAEKQYTFAVSETQKFGHVTYFWNGNRSGYIDPALETYIEVPSDNGDFDKNPAMKANEITAATIELIESGKYAFGRINFANGDMVGHTGDVAATARSIESVDKCLGELMRCIEQQQGILIFTADHGNADEMFVEKNGEKIMRTSHSLNPVPFAIFDPEFSGEYTIDEKCIGGLANVAATVFNLMGFIAPADYQPSLIKLQR